ncbi:MAG: FecR domain-containing protein [Candidatus Pseudobacter hemicellulosilyticus]|uniref:FecR domain-containing protein n=1 Tax=Candidatus Pseudobacter hemicellulosilyticus TaxID=3121375 RepID=A0AAJ5WNL6_9BACT|nr:MAG: FecR domain-containing protein [Pseudobacter sp.]
MDLQRVYELAHKWKNNSITTEEMEELNLYYNKKAKEGDILLSVDFVADEATHKARIWAVVANSSNAGKPGVRKLLNLRRWSVAAAILLLITAAAYLLLQNQQQAKTPENALASTDIGPGKAGAILTLADGRQLVLDSLGTGIIATQSGSNLVLQNGQLAYDPAATIHPTVTYNTMTTPKGRQFTLQLPDGTRVWLNAASSLRYPTSFTGSARNVEVTGEAYFEVARNSKQPFTVRINQKAEVEVLGTSFNITAYPDEPGIRTTLLEGAITVKEQKDSKAILLKPGQQAQLTDRVRITGQADIEKTMAWKNGLFNFENMPLPEVMKQLERWYDIEVIYEGKIPDVQFGGEMSRNVQLSSLLKALQESKVNCRLEGNRRLLVAAN